VMGAGASAMGAGAWAMGSEAHGDAGASGATVTGDSERDSNATGSGGTSLGVRSDCAD